MLQVLPAELGADGRCPQSVGGASEIAASDRSDDGGWRQGCDGHELSSPIDGMSHSRGWQPGSKVSMMIIRPPGGCDLGPAAGESAIRTLDPPQDGRRLETALF